MHIPKAGSSGETRPLGIPTFEDKLLQRVVLMVLEPVYETDFQDVSHGFRPGRGAHGALDSLWKQAMGLGCGWVVDVDLRKFFDTIDHGHLREFLKRRVRDGVKLRGPYAYYGIIGNFACLSAFLLGTRRIWRRWLSRRGRSTPLTWPEFVRLEQSYELPRARVVHSLARRVASRLPEMTSRMPELGTSGSVGALGEQSPRATRLFARESS